MRNHKGNVPVLPQTKLCPHCPAKFTRTTHLNRHLRNHSNARTHNCDLCGAQFTRSDLLSRHKKGCNDETGRSRRKSCVACTESKIKCDRKHPCGKCQSRGKECLFVPKARRNTARQVQMDPAIADGSSASQLSLDPSGPDDMFDTMSSYISSPVYLTGSHFGDTDGNSVASSDLYSSATSYTATSHTATESEFTGPPGYGNLSELYSGGDMFAPLFSNLFSASSPLETVVESPPYLDNMSSADSPVQSESVQFPEDHHTSNYEGFTNPSLFGSFVSTSTQLPDGQLGHVPSPGNYHVEGVPMDAERQHYLHLFFTAFLEQMPMVHAATFQLDRVPPMLLSVMQACGALYVKTRRASTFIMNTMATSREILTAEFAKELDTSYDQLYLILAVVLTQTIGLFHQKSDLRASSTLYHGMLIMMIRRSHFIAKTASWTPDRSMHLSVKEKWHDWAMHEMSKRALLLSYLHDCCHCIYFAAPPSYQPREVDVYLPCENKLWNAKTADEWWSALQEESPYGDGHSRLIGQSLLGMIDLVYETRVLASPVALSPFAHFVLAHSILRHLFTICSESRLQQNDVPAITSPENLPQQMYGIEFALHNWFRSWMHCPEKVQPKPDEEPPFMQNALPFFWLGQVAIMAHQDNLPPFENADNIRGDKRFPQVKKWLRHIREYLKKNDERSTLLWNELKKIRLQNWQEDDPDGLLGFFPDGAA
ncbi:hypothetical protein K435DRAFT_710917 [Dendrothele bispora CBS 962.96]|uniref:Zn(2)-C6 fungal-type domain-containing protein n=1 Tax=Dendrothele bispora (strain CBS 962.96) TaxID=1314807 RepID=A0A4S8MVG8_DENBC|nr:hypothetical protein K435DRAFT_710917 [Dendrothele bispora CBS 962.96]